MMNYADKIERLEKRLSRERNARQQAENLLEKKITQQQYMPFQKSNKKWMLTKS